MIFYAPWERVLTKPLSTIGYRPRLNTVYLRFTSSYGWPVCHEGKAMPLRFPPFKAAAPASPFFSIDGSETSSKKHHILMHIRRRLLLHLFFWPSKKHHILIIYEWPLHAVLHKKLSLRSFRRKRDSTHQDVAFFRRRLVAFGGQKRWSRSRCLIRIKMWRFLEDVSLPSTKKKVTLEPLPYTGV